MQRFWFNTGVDPAKTPGFPFEYHEKIGNSIAGGTLKIPLDVDDAPEGAALAFCSEYGNLKENEIRRGEMTVREIRGGNMATKYAYFDIPKQ